MNRLMRRNRIRGRILVTFISIALTGGVLQLLIAGRQLQVTTLEFFQHHLETDALLIASTLSDPMEQFLDGEGNRDVQRLLGNIQQQFGHDYVLVDNAYRIIGYTAGSGYEGRRQLDATRELQQAAVDPVGADTRPNAAGEDTLYVAVRVVYERQIVGYLVISRPVAPAYAQVEQQWLQLASTTLPVVVLVIVASLWISGTISRPVEHLRNSALRMAQGDLNARVEVRTQDEIGELATPLNYMAEQIGLVLKTQRSFVSNAAHELRTPLMSLKLRAEALDDNSLPADQRAVYLNEIRQEINHMAGLVSSLLVLARIDEGRHLPTEHVIDTAGALNDVARRWRIEAQRGGVAFESSIPADLPEVQLSSDEFRLVLDNVLGNAVKYTSRGTIRLNAQVQARSVVIRVKDSGIGFGTDQRDRLFDRFFRSSTVRARYEGHGLGLSIVQSVLESCGGHITAESEGEGLGALFTIQLPIQAADPTLHL